MLLARWGSMVAATGVVGNSLLRSASADGRAELENFVKLVLQLILWVGLSGEFKNLIGRVPRP